MSDVDYITLGLISALVAGNTEAVDHMVRAIAIHDSQRAADLLDAIKRGLAARQASPNTRQGDDRG